MRNNIMTFEHFNIAVSKLELTKEQQNNIFDLLNDYGIKNGIAYSLFKRARKIKEKKPKFNQYRFIILSLLNEVKN